MSTDVFTWYAHIRDGDEMPVTGFESFVSESGLPAVRDLDSGDRLSVNILVPFPQSGGTFAALYAFYRSHGQSDTWLYRAYNPEFRDVSAEAAGTASGGGGETFTTVFKHLDASTLVVKIGGTTQTITTQYTFTLNNTTPTVTTTASADTGAVTFDYSYYIPVRFSGPIGNPMVPGGPGLTLASPGIKMARVSAMEYKPDGRYA